MRSVRLWWRLLRCALRGHPLEAERVVRYVGPGGVVVQVDEWQSCACGRYHTTVRRRQIRQPYPVAS